ncbi:MAG: thioredoxin [Lachnospiraceae bacterium]|nr:thioredoxin [Lachnospiraceae bacterium]
MAEIKITKDNFEKEVKASEIPVLIDFWATWCGPCQMLGPVIAELAEELDGKVKVCKVNVDEEPELAARFSVSSIPMLAVVKDGKLVKTSVGYQPKESVLKLLD